MLGFNLLKKILFAMEPEAAHAWATRALSAAQKLGISRALAGPQISSPCSVMGLEFDNPVGLAAGFDKSADYIDALATLGFGFIEVGSITPRPQDGNPKPRLFRLSEKQAIINRMGFNNKGIEHAIKQLDKTQYKGILGINLGKNFDTPIEKATDDYIIGFRALWKYASYITINISSPNTPGLRDLHQQELLADLLKTMKAEQKSVHLQENKYIPLVVKVSPDMNDEQAQETAQIILNEKIDGVIATNTTVTRTGVEDSPFAKEQGGLSGAPLREQSTHIIRTMQRTLQDNIPIIASGGVMDAVSAKEKMDAGAKLVQVYTGLIYHGPQIIRDIVKTQIIN